MCVFVFLFIPISRANGHTIYSNLCCVVAVSSEFWLHCLMFKNKTKKRRCRDFNPINKSYKSFKFGENWHLGRSPSLWYILKDAATWALFCLTCWLTRDSASRMGQLEVCRSEKIALEIRKLNEIMEEN